MRTPTPPPPPAAAGAVAEAITPQPKKKPWSKPTIKISDDLLWTESGGTAYSNVENNQYHPVSQ